VRWLSGSAVLSNFFFYSDLNRCNHDGEGKTVPQLCDKKWVMPFKFTANTTVIYKNSVWNFKGKVTLLHDTFWDVKVFATSHSLESSISLVDLQTLKYSFVGNIQLPQI
jgi:hypothetical protein